MFCIKIQPRIRNLLPLSLFQSPLNTLPPNKINNLPGSDPEGADPEGGINELGGDVDVYAHRGSTLLAPENTATAFDLALQCGADILEIDVRLSRDNQVIVTHDKRIDRTCNGQGDVRSYTESELKKFDAGWHFKDLAGMSYRGRNITLMSLNDLFERFPDTRINIDIKDNSETAAKAVAACIEKANAHLRVNIGSFHGQALAQFREFAPDVTTAASQAEVAKLYFGRHLSRTLKFQYLQIPTAYYGLPLATNKFIKFAQAKGVSAVYWTINDSIQMEKLIARGVNGIVTDRVDLACQLLNKRKSK